MALIVYLHEPTSKQLVRLARKNKDFEIVLGKDTPRPIYFKTKEGRVYIIDNKYLVIDTVEHYTPTYAVITMSYGMFQASFNPHANIEINALDIVRSFISQVLQREPPVYKAKAKKWLTDYKIFDVNTLESAKSLIEWEEP